MKIIRSLALLILLPFSYAETSFMPMSGEHMDQLLQMMNITVQETQSLVPLPETHLSSLGVVSCEEYLGVQFEQTQQPTAIFWFAAQTSIEDKCGRISLVVPLSFDVAKLVMSAIESCRYDIYYSLSLNCRATLNSMHFNP